MVIIILDIIYFEADYDDFYVMSAGRMNYYA